MGGYPPPLSVVCTGGHGDFPLIMCVLPRLPQKKKPRSIRTDSKGQAKGDLRSGKNPGEGSEVFKFDSKGPKKNCGLCWMFININCKGFYL